VSKAAAEQRAGRSGRVADGLCIRLYSEPDFTARPGFPTPEIKRSNLSGIILRMHHLGLGRIEKFPFLQRPPAAAIRDGYNQLSDLGAIDRTGRLTDPGKAMAQLPLDSPVAAMLLYARRHKAVREVMIVAAALSIVDPRLSPSELPESYAAFPHRFVHPDSDFMTFVKLWDTVRSHESVLSSSARLHAFCKENGVSFHRMREWFDVHEQISRICGRLHGFHEESAPASYDAIHKSLLCGLIGNVAVRQESGLYRSARGHDIKIFPDSTLFKKRPDWVLFHEIVETNRVWGRTAAVISPAWIEELFPELCHYVYEDAHFDLDSGQVRAREVVSFHGLPLIANRRVDYGQVNRDEAHAIFVREALVGEKAGMSYGFIEHNHKVRQSIDRAERALRSRGYYIGDDALVDWYSEKLPGIASLPGLNRRLAGSDRGRFLCVNDEDLLSQPLPATLAGYSDEIVVAGISLPVEYRFTPGSTDDGATIAVPLGLYRSVPLYYWEWLLPAFWHERVVRCVDAIAARLPVEAGDAGSMVDDISQSLAVAPCSFRAALCRIIAERYGYALRTKELSPDLFPQHLWPCLAIHDEKCVVIETFRMPYNAPSLPFPLKGKRAALWEPFCAPWERAVTTEQVFGTIPSEVSICSPGQVLPLIGRCALCRENGELYVRVFFSPFTADTAHAQGILSLLENLLAEDLAWAARDLNIASLSARECTDLADPATLELMVQALFHRMVLCLPDVVPRDEVAFAHLCSDARGRLTTAGRECLRLLEAVEHEYHTCRDRLRRLSARHDNTFHGGIAEELRQELNCYRLKLLSPDTPLEIARSLPRFLAGFLHRIEAAFVNPGKYRAAVRAIAEYRSILEKAHAHQGSCSRAWRIAADRFETLIEEYAVALFAPLVAKTQTTVNEDALLRASDALIVGLEDENDYAAAYI
jgi:ATP-dependent helicase HrpA